jgi:glycosyltransferase involved in cell wall biosynthesis
MCLKRRDMLFPPSPASHILTFAQTLDGGGVEKTLLRLAGEWVATGRRVTVIVGDVAGPLMRDVPEGVDLLKVGTKTMVGMSAIARLTAEIDPDVLFCPGNHYTALAAWTRLRLGAHCPPIVAKVSNALVRRDHNVPLAAGYRAWLKWHPRFVDHLVAMSPAMADEASVMMGIARDQISVIPNPPPRAGSPCAPHTLPAGRFVLGVGRLAPQKRWDRLIDAFADIDHRDVSLMILGEGSERATIEARIAARGLDRRVVLPGHVEDPLPAITQATALALVSDFEGVPGVLRESLAVGTPVIATDSSVAVREIVTSPAVGSVVVPGDAAGLVAALDHWLEPGRSRPQPIPQPGRNAAAAYLDLFDQAVLERRFKRGLRRAV